MLVINISRDPNTGRFFIDAESREDFEGFDPLIQRNDSPTRFAATVHELTGRALAQYLALVARRWGDVLERELVDVVELAGLLAPPTD
jgi:hypothetical protein